MSAPNFIRVRIPVAVADELARMKRGLIDDGRNERRVLDALKVYMIALGNSQISADAFDMPAACKVCVKRIRRPAARRKGRRR